ncbi:MAG: hypothetical protein D6713_08620 [Deltaproteobacteria bacterium]|nr:MAG: hypothetical protein D6713_08620 [Deltaproteobacteria bacterium]
MITGGEGEDLPVWALIGIVGLVVIIGFFSVILFRKTGFPDIILLISLGILIGPVFHLVERELFLKASGFFGALALIVIMLDGGLSLELEKVLRQFRFASFLTLAGFAGTFFFLSLLLARVGGFETLPAMILSSALSCSSAAIVVPLLKEIRVPESVRTALSLEAALSDTLAVVVTIILISIARAGGVSPFFVVWSLFSAFGVSLVVGFAAGYLWTRALTRYYDLPFDYMLTFAILLVLYSLLEIIHGSGPLGVMVFGLVMANVKPIEKEMRRNLVFFGLRMRTRSETVDENFLWFHEEITFLIRVFFFVYIGTLFDFRELSFKVIALSLASVVAIYGVRSLLLSLLGKSEDVFSRMRKVMLTTAPRGLATAVLALLPASFGIAGTGDFGRYALFVIVLTNVVLAVGTFGLGGEEPVFGKDNGGE